MTTTLEKDEVVMVPARVVPASAAVRRPTQADATAMTVYRDPISQNFVAVDPRVADVPSAMAAAGQLFHYDPELRGALRAAAEWVKETKPKTRRRGSLFDRDAYVSPDTPIAKMLMARAALTDDVVGGAADVTEEIALPKMTFRSEDPDEAAVWNQWAELIDLDDLMKRIWRTDFTDSHVVMAWLPGRHTFRMKGRTVDDDGQKGALRRKKYENVLVPAEVTLLPADRVIPVGNTLFTGRERLAYVATAAEAERFDAILQERTERRRTIAANARSLSPANLDALLGRIDDGVFTVTSDDIVERLVLGRYEPDLEEAARIRRYGVTDTRHLFLLDPARVSRYCRTRSAGQAFSDIRAESWFELLDAKRQLRQKDRAYLIGGANFIVVVTLGLDEDKQGPKPEEMHALQKGVKTLAEVPVMVGDQRLEVKIVSVTDDQTLERDRHDTLDVRLFARVWGGIVPTGGAANDDPIKLGRVIAQGLQGRRKRHRRWIERTLIKFIFDSNPDLKTEAKLVFPPIMLAFDQAWMMALLELREKNEISRETMLEALGLAQDLEAQLRELEAKVFDHIFETAPPPGAPSPTTRRRVGREGGKPGNKGGGAPGTRQGQAPINLPNKRAVRRANASVARREASALGLRPGRRLKDEVADLLIANLDAYAAEDPDFDPGPDPGPAVEGHVPPDLDPDPDLEVDGDVDD